MIWTTDIFSALAYCLQPPAGVATSNPFTHWGPDAPWTTLIDLAERHGVEPLVADALAQAFVPPPRQAGARLRARVLQHAHAARVRATVLGEVFEGLARGAVPSLVLKGAALAHLVYAHPRLRPMRDLDILVPAADAWRAWTILRRMGFSPYGPTPPAGHHHLPAVAQVVDEVTVAIELHHALVPPTSLAVSPSYDILAAASQPLMIGQHQLRTLGREDMVWHLFTHGFVVNTLSPAFRPVAIADLAHAVESWIDELDWEALRKRDRTLVRGLALLGTVAPWSPRVRQRFNIPLVRAHSVVPLFDDERPTWRDVYWPRESWFRVRYGVDGVGRWLWNRLCAHPMHVATSVLYVAQLRVRQRLLRWSTSRSRRRSAARVARPI